MIHIHHLGRLLIGLREHREQDKLYPMKYKKILKCAWKIVKARVHENQKRL